MLCQIFYKAHKLKTIFYLYGSFALVVVKKNWKFRKGANITSG